MLHAHYGFLFSYQCQLDISLFSSHFLVETSYYVKSNAWKISKVETNAMSLRCIYGIAHNHKIHINNSGQPNCCLVVLCYQLSNVRMFLYHKIAILSELHMMTNKIQSFQIKPIQHLFSSPKLFLFMNKIKSSHSISVTYSKKFL